MSLAKLRKQIDAIDRKWMGLIRRRLDVTKQIARLKKRKRMPIVDLEREQSMRARARCLAQEQGVSPLMMERLFRIVLIYAKKEMKKSG